MKIFIAGATGVLGRPLTKALVSQGHDVTGLTRNPERARFLESMGARAAVADALDVAALSKAVRAAAPSHVAHLLTALPPQGATRASGLRETNRVRIEGTANLLRAAVAAGAKRVVAESFLAVYGAADFRAPQDEDAPLPPAGDGALRETILALRNLEEQLGSARARGEIETVALRFGALYGRDVPSMNFLLNQLRAGRIAQPRGATGVMSFIHVDDAVNALVAAITTDAPSAVYNIVDDEPLALTEYLALLASAVHARPPRQLPRWVIRLLAPVFAEAAFTRMPLSNAKAHRELGWRPTQSLLHTLAGLETTA